VESCRQDSSVAGQGPVTGSCDRSNEPSSCIKGREFYY